MIQNVTDVIVARSREPEGLRTMIAWSVAGHIGLAVLAMLWPGSSDAPPREVMTISLGGAPGPDTGGRTQAGGQSVQTPLEAAKPVDTPPAATTPVMSLPAPRPRPRPRTTPQEAPPDATATTPNAGEQPREGATRVRGQGFGPSPGLSSSGGHGGAVTLDVPDFCCWEYIDRMADLIRVSWDQKQGVIGSTTMQFTILKNGVIQSPQVERSSGFVVLDNAAMRALQLTRLPPLPAAFENPTLTVHLRFDYQR